MFKLKDKSTPPTKNVKSGSPIKISIEIIKTGNCLPSCSCFFFANFIKKNTKIIAIIKVVKKTSKFVQIGAGVKKPFIVIKDDPNIIVAS